MKALDGAAIINMLRPVKCKTFEEYSSLIFLPFVKKQAQGASRLDVVWDINISNSLKQHTKEQRGKGIRRRVSAKVVIPGDWSSFLRIDENKTELFTFFSRISCKAKSGWSTKCEH